MCGIVGYIGNKNVKNILLSGLKNLEYRGYDSSGISMLNDKIITFKTEGKIINLENIIKDKKIKCNLGIGHTRWATHGSPSVKNSHPHMSSDGKIAVVHNGIIENYMEIKTQLIAKGYQFISDTDTEVLVHLYHYFYDGNLLDAFYKMISNIKGSFSICLICEDYKDKFIVAKKDSPLIIGIGNDENFVASDMPAILEYTKNYYLLDDMEVAIIEKDDITIFDENKNIIKKEIFKANFDIETSEKCGYEHFMLKEIFEQSQCIKRCVQNNIKDDDIFFDNFSMEDKQIKNINTIHIIACGSAWHAGMVGKYVIEDMCRIPVNLDIASEFRYRNPILNKNDICIVISQSGETADTLAALRLVKQKGIRVISIVNVVGSSVARESDDVLYTLAGIEIAVATTKGYSTQLVMLYMLALKFVYIRGNITKVEFRENIENIKNLHSYVSDTFCCEDILKKIANKYYNIQNAFFIGRGIDYSISLESALKLKEISYIHSEGYPAGELKHGSIALIEKDTLIFAILTQDVLIDKTISNIKEVKSRGATVIALTKEKYNKVDIPADEIIYIKDFEERFITSIAIIPMQLLSYYIAKNRGCDIDKPRNLAKSVTVE